MKITIPNLGDGIDSATVLSVMVAEGDAIAEDQILLELETDKAVAPVPATEAGTIASLHIKEGDTVTTGALVAMLTGGGATAAPAAAQEAVPQPVAAQPAPVAAAPAQPSTALPTAPVVASAHGIAASPSIRRFAAECGLDLTKVPATGNGGRITSQDLKNYFYHLQNQAPVTASTEEATAAPAAKKVSALPDFSKWGEIDTVKATSLRKKIGEKMSESWQTVPHVTQFDEANLTQLMDVRKKLNKKLEKKGVKLTVTTLVLKAVIDALKEFPLLNASYNPETNEVIYKKYFNLGVAVDTDNGLIVPVIKNADQKDLQTLGSELVGLAEKARDRKIGVEDLQGGTFTVSNLGSLGVGPFTPIINTPELAILGLGRGNEVPYVDGKTLKTKMMLPLSLSYDHRVIDGADGARFIRKIIDNIENFSL